MNEKLAIVIPAYKHQFLGQTLESIVDQTCKKFNLYIGDDASPFDLKSIIDPFRKRITINYKRFEENQGLVSLTRQWGRCIELTENEEYIWLFSDDDLMPFDAVERFYKEIEKGEYYDLFRFNLQFINEENCLVRDKSNHPRFESSNDFLKRRLTFSTISAVCEYIFSRKTYKENSGFVEFPLAWCSDDATWAVFAGMTGVITIEGEPVSLRMSSGLNISSDIKNNKLKFSAIVSFVIWINLNFKNDLDKKYYYLYLRSQINVLSVTLKQRFALSASLFKYVNPILLFSLILNRSIVYKSVDRLLNIDNK